jgi:hypothetical protein
MNIEQFYAANEARRSSGEIEFGDAWTDAHGARNELSWIVDTGELYLMLSPTAIVSEDLFFGTTLHLDDAMEGLRVFVLANVPTHDAVATLLDGWANAMEQPNSLQWLSDRLPSPPPPT